MSIVDPPEGTTPIDADEAGLLKLTHITTRGELNRWEQDNIVEALTWLDKTKSSDILNASRVTSGHPSLLCSSTLRLRLNWPRPTDSPKTLVCLLLLSEVFLPVTVWAKRHSILNRVFAAVCQSTDMVDFEIRTAVG